MIAMTVTEQIEARKVVEDFCAQCRLEFPEEVAELFEAYTRWIWQYKCVGAVYKYYADDTVVYLGGGGKIVGADAVVAATLSTLQSFPDQICNFVDIFAEGNVEDGYYFGQVTSYEWTNTGWSQYGPPTGKSLHEGGRKCVSTCECRVKKVEGRWRITEEWLVRSHDAMIAVLQPDN